MSDDEYLAARSASSAQRAKRILDLKRKLAARTGNPAHNENCKAIEEEISRLENLSAAEEIGREETGE